jgi:hypothetical protein
VSDVERIAQIRRRVPGLMHQWYGQDVPFLLAALDEANTEREKTQDRADFIRNLYIDLRGRTRLALNLDNHPRSLGEHDDVVDEITEAIAALAGEGSEQLPAKPGGPDGA